MSTHEHQWYIASISTIVTLREGSAGEVVLDSMSADLRCCSCRAGVSQLSMEHLRDEIAQGHVRGDSLAQWASIAPLFR